ncbi:F18 fimbrial protein FedE [Escherichia coli]|nr:F18 fimbrial protein FedE [Escherichia coli]
MKFTKAALALLMMMVMTDSGQAATTTLTIDVTFARPSCNIQVPSSYELGPLVPGKSGVEHSPLRITWSCEGTPLKTALIAAISSGYSEGDWKVNLMTNDRQRTGVTLSLRDNTSSALIKLTGTEDFCSHTEGSGTCILTPVTDVTRDSVLGNASATLSFEVKYYV